MQKRGFCWRGGFLRCRTARTEHRVSAFRVDSGYLDLDITLPAPLVGDAGNGSALKRRALLVDAADAEVLRSGLAQANMPEIDVVSNTDMAAALMGRNAYSCAVFNLDEHQVHAWTLAQLFSARFPQAKSFALSETGGWAVGLVEPALPAAQQQASKRACRLCWCARFRRALSHPGSIGGHRRDRLAPRQFPSETRWIQRLDQIGFDR